MRKYRERNQRIAALLTAIVLLVAMAGCTPFDDDYGTQSKPQKTSSHQLAGVKIPEIKSDDTVMPTYFDISLYDEENYADIYLGKGFKYKIIYAGSVLEVPTNCRDMSKLGWNVMESEDYNSQSTILAGQSVRVQMANEYGKQITALFFNDSKSSVELKKCPIVKFIVSENVLYAPDSVYGTFFINGISNESAITDIVQYLGYPSHFYAVSDDEYYLDYFLTEKDKRSGITVYVDPANDSVSAIEISKY